MQGLMQAVVKSAAGPGFTLAQVPIPQIGPHDILLRTRATSICGTDIHIYNWDTWAANRIKPPIIIGHEFCGDVIEIGAQVTEVKVGDFISAESHIVDHTCDLCRTGMAHICRNTQIIGVDRDGSFAEYVALPAANAWHNPPNMPSEIAALEENFGNAVHTALETPVVARKVLVTGCGPVGVMTIAVTKAAGARSIYASDISEYRLGLAKKMGADIAINPSREDLREIILKDTNGEGVDVLLEMSGAPSAIRDGLHLLKAGGHAVLLGLPSKPFEFDLANLVIMKGITLHGIAGRKLWETWYEIRGLLRSGTVNLEPVITHRFKLEEFQKAFETMMSGDSGKVVLFP
ncbi:MAG: L-threonine 3-dehydrogenase [Chloroflexota bacterium]|nr:MAG: L-threonine 3-dehydrogenase [Chloroflexota bacterium]